MDHKVSKDMISSGMIPSGEKTQADLGRTQYGSAPSPNSLFDAYKSMYEHHQKDKDGNTIPHEGEELNEGKIPAGLQAYLDKKKGKKEDKKEVKEMIERIAGGPARNQMGKVVTKSPAKAFGDLLPKDKNKTKSSYNFDKDSLAMKNKVDKRKLEVAKSKDERREKVTNIVNKMGESADLFDVISTYFIEEGYDEKDVYAAMSSVDLTEEVQDLHEFIPAILAGAAKVGAALAKGGAMAAKAVKAGGAAIKTGASAIKSGAGKLISKVKQPPMQGPKTAPMQGPRQANLGDKVKQGIKKVGQYVKDNPTSSYMIARDMTSGSGSAAGQTRTSSISASADLFDIVKGQLIDEGLSEEEIKDIMLTLTPDEIMKEIEESSMSAGSSGGHYSDGGDGVFRSKEQVARQFNKNFPPAKNGKVDKPTRKAINTSARDFGIQGPTTLKQSVEPEGETI